ncbi:MAG: GMC oxidoreductase [Actinomycetes bacterium]
MTSTGRSRYDEVDTVDAVIVGSGPGGSTAAEVLTAAGWSVVMLERGANHLVDTEAPYDLRFHFSNDELKFRHRHFLGPDPLVEPRTFRRASSGADRDWTGPVNDLPATVGGGGVHADGKLPRFRPEDFKCVSANGPMPGADLVDWPVTYDEMEPYYTAAEYVVGVSGIATGPTSNPFAAWRSAPYPMPPGPPMYGALLSSKAAEELGYHPYEAPTGANSVFYDGRGACINCGHCAFFGCPVHAKGDPVGPLRKALQTGRMRLWPECFATRVVVQNGAATGVDFLDHEGQPRHVAGRHVVIAGGAMETPRLALLSGLGGPHVGRYIMFHFQTLTAGSMPFRVFAERGRDVTHAHDDSIVPDAAAMAAAKDADLPWIRGGFTEHGGGGHPIDESKRLPSGPQHRELMKASQLRQHLWAFTLQGEDMPVATNVLDLDPSVKDVNGVPVARVTHAPHKHEFVCTAHWGPRNEEILKRMGALWAFSTTSPAPDYDYGEFISPISESKHVMGTMRMGPDPAGSVTDPYGRLHDVPNVLVADSSVFPTSAGYGPTLTLVAMTLRNAHALAGTSLPPLDVITAPAREAGTLA